MSHDIVLSYAYRDAERIRPLREALDSLGYVTWDGSAIEPGAPMSETIAQAIEQAACVLLVWTEAAAESAWLEAERRIADESHKLVLVLMAPYHGNVTGIDLTDWNGAVGHPAFLRLYRAILPLAGERPAARLALGDAAHAAETRRIRIPDIAWIEIPGGPFIYQQDERRELPTFWIAKYPVTNAQYQCFIDDGGYDDPRWWTDLERSEPEPSQWPQGNRPRTNVNWYECVAFCRWLNACLGLSQDRIRLPTEVEWERAARGPSGREYPWGTGYRSGMANVDETRSNRGKWALRQTTAAGVYPHAETPEGIADVAGNVWEWCQNHHDDPKSVDSKPNRAARALRGGSWNDLEDVAAGAYRNTNRLLKRDHYRGFRLCSGVSVRLPASSSDLL
jgi:hypothetical protein